MAFTPTQGNVIAAIDLCEIFISKFSGQLNAGGYVNFWQDADRTVPKLVYEQVNNGGSPPTYSYVALPDPIYLSGTGNFQDSGGNNIAVYYFPYDANGNIQLYYIEVFDVNNQSQFTREAWPPLWSIQSGSITTVINNINAGRLTLTSGVPVTITDVTAATTIYYTPYKGNGILLYVSGTWAAYTFGEISIAVPGSTDQIYDVFAYPLASAVTLTLIAWTNDTTRATAIMLQNGVYVSAANASYRYLGNFRTTGTVGQTEDSIANRFLWNYYNRVKKDMNAFDSAASWNYTTATWRQADAKATNQLNFIIGVTEDIIEATVNASASNTAGGGAICNIYASIGFNSTTVPATGSMIAYSQTTATNGGIAPLTAKYDGFANIGLNYLAWLEYSQANGGTTTFYGSSAGIYQCGITGSIFC